MTLSSQKRIAADILNVGEKRVWIDPEQREQAEEAITRNDIRNLIESGVVQKKPFKGTSRGRARHIQQQKARKRRKGHGKRKGRKQARKSRKAAWMERIRSQRQFLKQLKATGDITLAEYWRLYRMASGGFFRDRKHIQVQLNKIREEV